jgi:uncharacterized membrane protein YraQ (UPF0718 family)
VQVVVEILKIAWAEAARMWWFTVLGIAVAALIKTLQWDRKVAQQVGRAGGWAVVLATLLGALSPLCSCGVLPVVIPLAVSGVPLPPLMALLVTSPVSDPASLFLTWSAVGPELAWWKLGGALFLGLSAGFGTAALQRTGFLSGDMLRLKPVYTPEGGLAAAFDIACAHGFRVKTMKIVPRESKFRFFLDRFKDVGLFVGTWVGMAILLDAVLQALVPVNAVTWLVGRTGPLAVVAAAAVGLPLPLNQIAIVPILAGLQAKGMAKGADLAFLLAGPVSSIPAMAALTAMFRPRLVIFFVAVGFLGSVLLGLLRMAVG